MTGQLEDIFKDHLNITRGGDPISTSPLMMAEAFLRIVQGNRSPSLLTYQERDSGPKMTKFKCLGYDSNTYWETLRGTLFKGLWKVINEKGGTLFNEELRQLQTTLSNRDGNNKIYLYGKTGTCNDNKNHHYAFILTNQPLHDINTTIDKNHLKIYVIYFGFYETDSYGHTNTQTYTRAIIKSIIESETFKNYWDE